MDYAIRIYNDMAVAEGAPDLSTCWYETGVIHEDIYRETVAWTLEIARKEMKERLQMQGTRAQWNPSHSDGLPRMDVSSRRPQLNSEVVQLNEHNII